MVISDPHDEAIDSLVLALNDSLGEDDSVVCMACSICDPEFLGQGSWRVDLKFLSRCIVNRCSLHLRRIITVAELGEAEAAHVLQVRYFFHEGQVALGMQGH